MICVGNIKLVMVQNENSMGFDALYDLKDDPLEMRNIMVSPKSPEKNREQAKRTKVLLVKWMRKHEPSKPDELEKREI